MNRTAADILRHLEMRVARLEGRTASNRMASMDWDTPAVYNHPVMQAVRKLKGTRLSGFTLTESGSGASAWVKDEDWIYVTYEGGNTTFVFHHEDEYGRPLGTVRINVGRGGNSVEADFLNASKEALAKL